VRALPIAPAVRSGLEQFPQAPACDRKMKKISKMCAVLSLWRQTLGAGKEFKEAINKATRRCNCLHKCLDTGLSSLHLRDFPQLDMVKALLASFPHRDHLLVFPRCSPLGLEW
jgi:hypothetical protein